MKVYFKIQLRLSYTLLLLHKPRFPPFLVCENRISGVILRESLLCFYAEINFFEESM